MKQLLKIKFIFDYLTSNHSKNWQLIIFWILMFELLASLFDYNFLSNSSSYIPVINHSISTELIISIFFVFFIWISIMNLLFWNLKNFFYTILYGFFFMYIFFTNDVNLSFLFHNIEPIHFFSNSFSLFLCIELFIKVIITYLFYQLFVSLKARKSEKD
ncbi:MAG: hypothetical protein MJK08_03675 [Campylobacterales bacterium]|nr:hypothetical protein [Campylobacterales bacterium]